MSNAHWRTRKQTEPFDIGGNATDRVGIYVQTWKGRCYSGGIPQEVPKGIADQNRAPSWKAIAIALLKNDLKLKALGFGRRLTRRQAQLQDHLKSSVRPANQLPIAFPVHDHDLR